MGARRLGGIRGGRRRGPHCVMLFLFRRVRIGSFPLGIGAVYVVSWMWRGLFNGLLSGKVGGLPWVGIESMQLGIAAPLWMNCGWYDVCINDYLKW